ncbi:hypothetical protein Q7P37_007661 [Cladosporium fusiforme]
MSTIPQSTAQDVGAMYDEHTPLMTDIMAGFIHVGFWASPSTPTESVEVATQRMTSEVVSRLRPVSGQRLLDVGCGTGKTAAHIATTHPGTSISGITVSKNQIATASASYEQLVSAGRLVFHFANAMEPLPFPSQSFDGAYAIESLVHMDDRPTALRNIAHQLKPGSRFSIADFVLDEACPDPEAIANWHELFQVPALCSVAELKGMLGEAGFRVLDCVDVREHIRPICGFMDEKGKEVGGEAGERLREVAQSLHAFGALGYVLLVAERV